MENKRKIMASKDIKKDKKLITKTRITQSFGAMSEILVFLEQD